MRAIVPKTPQFSRLSHKIEVLSRAYMESEQADFGQSGDFTPLETRIMVCLNSHFGSIVSSDRLMDAVYFDQEDEALSGIINVRICSIRKKLASSPFMIENVHGRGYRLTKR